MQTYELLVSGRSVRAASVDTTLVRTSIGIDQVHVLFDNAEWLGFPITATFGMGDVVRTAQAIVSEVDGEDWVAETTVTIPHEVIRNVGRIRVTFQGTDSQGRHIITAYGAPLSVVEAGDVEIGGVPEDAPTVDEWQQMRADAQRAINDAQSLVNNLQSQLDSIVSAAEGSLDGTIRDAEEAMAAIVASTRPIATESSLGMVMVGDGLNVTEEGVLSSYGLTQAQRRALANLIELASKVTDADVTGTVQASPTIALAALPTATPLNLGMVMPDGTTIRVDDEGMIHAYITEIDVATTSQTGVVKPDGTTITVDDDGTIHGAIQVPVATTTLLGRVKPDGTTITVDVYGTISVPTATTSKKGIVSVPSGGGLYLSNGGLRADTATSTSRGMVSVPTDGGLYVSSNGAIRAHVSDTSSVGVVKPDGTTITVAADGTISGAIATSTTKGMVSVPTGNGLYVSNGVLNAYTASTTGRGVVQLAEDGGLVNDVSSRLMVRDATNEMSGKVVPDAETVGIVDGKLSVVSGTTEVKHTTPFSLEGMDYAVIRLAEDGVVESLAGGAIQFSFDYDYGIYGSGTSSSGFSLRQMFVREGDLADEARINPDSSVTVVRNTAAILLRGAAPYDTNAPYNLTEYQRYWSQLGVEKTQADLEAFAIAKAAELSGDATISTLADANAYFSENPYTEVRPLSKPVSYSSGSVFSGPLNAVYRLKDIQGYPGPRGLSFEWWWSEYEFVPGFPTATPTSLGMVRPDGTTIVVDADGTIHGTDQASVATTALAGKVKPDGMTITVDADGTIHGATTYELPDATGTTKGGVSVDASNGLTISGGRLGMSVASTSGKGVVSIAGDGAITSEQGAIDVRVATDEQTGVVKPDGTTIEASDGTISVAQSLLATIADLRRRVAALEGVTASMEDGYLETTDPMVDGYLESGGTMADGYLTY